MPIYEYACTACDHRTDILHGINDPGPKFCPSCGEEGTMKKVWAAPAIHYKGSGWAKKDRSTASRSKSKKADAKADGDAGKTDGAKTDGDKGGSTSSDASKSDSSGSAGASTSSD
jgi:putative FmdB family regulatory protein